LKLQYDTSAIGYDNLLENPGNITTDTAPNSVNITEITGGTDNYNGSTYTHLLGIADWYSFHYLAIRYGY
jgi:hypothetical protein